MIQQQQRVVDTWEGKLRANGGSLRPDRSYWCTIDYKHIGNRWVYRSIDQSDGSRQSFLRLEPSQTKETLSIFVFMNGNAKDQMKHFLDKTRQMEKFIRTSKVEKKKLGIPLQ